MLNFLRKLLAVPTAPSTAKPRYTEEELMTRLKVFIGVCLALTLFGIVFVVLYSLIFVTQPLNAISPIDNKFFELIIPIATFLTGTLSGIMLAGGKPKDLPLPIAPKPAAVVPPTTSSTPQTPAPSVAVPTVAAPPRVAVPPIVRPGE